MSKAWVGVTALAIVLGGVVGYVVVRSKAPDLSPVGPNRDLAPESLAVYAELPDVNGTWTKMQKTDAWGDLVASKFAEKLLDAQPVKDFLAALDEVSKKAAYPLDAKNSMKFVGRECSIGLALDAKGGAPQVLVLTKLDVEALSKDFLGGNVNLDALWGELQRRTSKVDFVVTASDYKEHKIATAARGDAKYHAALLGDTLAVATDAALVHAAIECRIAKGEHSLGRKAGFQADVKGLAPGTAVFEWYDLDALDANRTSLDSGLKSLGVPSTGIAAAHGVLDATRGAHSVAFSAAVPEGDLYRSTWTFSKSADLFADKAVPTLRDLCSGEWIAYGELRDVGSLVEAWSKSALRKKLGTSELGKWFDELMDEPNAQMEKALSLLPGRSGRAIGVGRPRRGPGGAPADDEDAGGPADEGRKMIDRFAMKMGRHALAEQADALLNGETVGAVDWSGKEDDKPRFAWSIRLDVQGRLLAAAVMGAAAEEKKSEVVAEQFGTRTVFAVHAGDMPVYWSLVGDAFLLTNDHELARSAATSGGAGLPGPSQRLKDSIAATKAGWRAFAWIDYERFMKVMESVSEMRGGVPQFGKLMDTYRELGLVGREASFAAYVPDDFSSFEMTTRMAVAEGAGGAMRGGDREPLCWGALPDTTFAHGVSTAFGLPSIWQIVKQVAGPNGVKEVEDGFRDQMGMDLEKDVISAFGHEMSLAVTFQAAPPPKAAGSGGPGGPEFAIPGVLLGLEVKDAARVKKALERAFEIAEASAAEPGRAPPKLFAREARDGVEIVRLVLPPEQQAQIPVHPALALHDGYLLVSTDVDVLRAAVDVRKGKVKGLADTPLFGRATAALGRKNSGFGLVDWSRLLDQVNQYAPMMAGLFASGDVKFPDYPEDGNQEEWNRRVAEYQKQMEAARASGGDKVTKWIDSFRVVDFIGSSSRMSPGLAESTMLVQFSK